MADAIDDLLRLALFEGWGERCVWCRRPLHFNEMEVEHLVPKSLPEKDKVRLIESHGLDSDFDLHALENLAPSCGPCNRGKGRKPPPEAPVIATLLQTAKEKAPELRTTGEKLRSGRRIRQAATVLRAGAQGGDEAALAALREAADEVNRDFRDATGREVGLLHSALDRLTDVGGFLGRSDAHFSYPAAAHEAGGPSPPVTPGSIMSVSETRGTVTSRIDAVPRDDEALERYGPQFTLSPADSEAGEKAATLLEEALREGRSVEIGEGIDVTFERLPPAFAELTGQRLTGGRLRVGEAEAPRPPIPDWDAQLRAETKVGESPSVRVRLRQVERAPEPWDDALVGHYGGMTVTALMRRTKTGGEIRFNLRHERDRSPVREQLEALRFLEALSQGGEFVAIDRGDSDRPDFRVAIPARTVQFHAEGRALLAFLTDLRLLEDWTGVEFEVPREIPGEEARHIAILAAMVRNGRRSVTWSNAHLTLPESSVDELRGGGPMRVEQRASSVVLGREVEMGFLQKDLPAYKVVSVEPSNDEPGYVEVEIQPPSTKAAQIVERLLRHRTQPRRPPPPSPRKALRERRKKQRKQRKEKKRR